MEQNRFRCHISIILNKIGGLLVFAGVLLYNNLEDVLTFIKSGNMPEGKMLPMLLIALAAAVFYTMFHFIRWYKTWIMFESESIVIERDTLNRKVNTIGMKNISNVNLEQNLFQRLIHVFQVKLDTNSATTANHTDVNIVLKEDMARAFQQKVQEHLDCKTPVQQKKASGDHEREIIYNEGQVVNHCLSTLKISWVLAGIFTVVIAIIGLQNQIDEAADLLDMLGVVLAVLAFFVTTVWKIVGDFFRLYGFQVRRSQNRLYLSYGLIKKQEFIIPVEKINAVVIRQNMMARILKRQYVELVCIGLGDDKKEGTQIMLASTRKELEINMKLLLPEYEKIIHIQVEKQPPDIVRSNVPGYLLQLIFYILCAAGFYKIKPEWVMQEIMVFAAVILLRIISEILVYHTVGIFCDDMGITIADGIFMKRMIYISYDKLEILKIKQGPIKRRYGLYQGEIKILAAMLYSVYMTGFYREEIFEKIHENMLRKS